MLIRILAMIAHAFIEEYQKLEEKPEHPDESVLSFSSALNPAQTCDAFSEGPAIGFNKRTAL